jgi:E3 ubiquitin-protein ligase TRIP12
VLTDAVGRAVEFELEGAPPLTLAGQRLAMLIQARCMENGLVIMGFTNGADLAGSRGEHVVLAPPYNVTPPQVDAIVDRLVASIEDVLRAHMAA